MKMSDQSTPPTQPMPPRLDLPAARHLEKLRRVPIRDFNASSKGRNAFLAQAQSLRLQEPSIRLSWYEWMGRLLKPRPGLLLRLLVVVLVVSGVIVAMSGLATATQHSLPGNPLYGLKSSLENTQIAFANAAQQRVDLAMTYAYRRVKEIEALDSAGVAVPPEIYQRMHRQMVYAFESAAELSDPDMQKVLQELDGQLLLQEEIVRRLKTPAPDGTLALLDRQRTWAELGLVEPQGYREQLRQLGIAPLLTK